jgi:hypothetical protein
MYIFLLSGDSRIRLQQNFPKIDVLPFDWGPRRGLDPSEYGSSAKSLPFRSNFRSNFYSTYKNSLLTPVKNYVCTELRVERNCRLVEGWSPGIYSSRIFCQGFAKSMQSIKFRTTRLCGLENDDMEGLLEIGALYVGKLLQREKICHKNSI